MAVLLETSKGDIVIDLLCEDAPVAAKNFLKLCKIKYYNDCLFHDVQKNFIVQTGDPTGTGRGGTSVFGRLYGDQARYFEDEIRETGGPTHDKVGTVGMASAGPDLNASQFYITTAAHLDSLDGKRTVFGEVTEGLDVLARINDAFCDDKGRPWQNVRIKHTIVLDDPFDDPPHLDALIPAEGSPVPVRDPSDGRLEDDWQPEEDTRDAEEVERATAASEAKSRAVVLEMIGDLPNAEATPEENMLFVCKLNPVTTEDDLEIIFSRFGTVTSCDVIRDWKTGDSLCYAFVGFGTKKAAEQAYFKMDNVLIDDRRIKVDFSQSMHHQWRMYRKTGRASREMQEGARGAAHGTAGRGRGAGGAPPARFVPPPPVRAPPEEARPPTRRGREDGGRGEGDRSGHRSGRHRHHRRSGDSGGEHSRRRHRHKHRHRSRERERSPLR